MIALAIIAGIIGCFSALAALVSFVWGAVEWWLQIVVYPRKIYNANDGEHLEYLESLIREQKFRRYWARHDLVVLAISAPIAIISILTMGLALQAGG